MERTLIIDRYEKHDNTIYSHILYKSKNINRSFEGIERLGAEIEKGTYRGLWTYSNKFDKHLYLIEHDFRRGLRIHHGNTYKDTVGCVIIGNYRHNDMVLESRKALNMLHALSERKTLKIIINEKFS